MDHVWIPLAWIQFGSRLYFDVIPLGSRMDFAARIQFGYRYAAWIPFGSRLDPAWIPHGSRFDYVWIPLVSRLDIGGIPLLFAVCIKFGYRVDNV